MEDDSRSNKGMRGAWLETLAYLPLEKHPSTQIRMFRTETQNSPQSNGRDRLTWGRKRKERPSDQ